MLPLIPPKLPKKPDRRGRSMEQLFDRIQAGEKERRAFRDRRASPRVAVTLNCEAVQDETPVLAQTADLSTFGMALTGIPTPKLGSRMTFRLYLPDDLDAPVELTAEVLGAWNEHGGARLRFINPDVATIRRIHRLLKE